MNILFSCQQNSGWPVEPRFSPQIPSEAALKKERCIYFFTIWEYSISISNAWQLRDAHSNCSCWNLRGFIAASFHQMKSFWMYFYTVQGPVVLNNSVFLLMRPAVGRRLRPPLCTSQCGYSQRKQEQKEGKKLCRHDIQIKHLVWSASV